MIQMCHTVSLVTSEEFLNNQNQFSPWFIEPLPGYTFGSVKGSLPVFLQGESPCFLLEMQTLVIIFPCQWKVQCLGNVFLSHQNDQVSYSCLLLSIIIHKFPCCTLTVAIKSLQESYEPYLIQLFYCFLPPVLYLKFQLYPGSHIFCELVNISFYYH